ncbi:MAG: YihY family inner membrane protein [Succinivibrio sp.]|nr:YihY family inner membrane protein [Succinivibrio sp.]
MRELFRYFIGRIRRDGLGLEASALSFTSILALIPALTVVLSVFAVVPSFQGVREALKQFASKNFMPVFTEQVGNYVGDLVEHAAKLTVTSTLVFFVIALLLVRSIDFSLNRIWRGGRRKFGQTMAIYWTLLTLGPLAVGLIIFITSKVIAYAAASGGVVGVPLLIAYFVFPVLIEIIVITALFLVVPAVQVRLQDALLGAVFVTVLFEISKKIFSVFVLNFSNYQMVYGALAALPVLMVWIYINWWIVLLGAEFTATLGVVRSGMGDEVPPFMVYLANITGSTLGSENAIKVRRKAAINIKVSKRQKQA